MEQGGAAEVCDWFLPPSKFMMDTCVKGGYSPEKFKVLCNFIDVTKVPEPKHISEYKQEYYVYLGRVNEVKGVRTLCQAAALLDKKLIVIGEGELLPNCKLPIRIVPTSSLRVRCSGRSFCQYCVRQG